MQTPQTKVLRMRPRSTVCIRMQKDPMGTLKDSCSPCQSLLDYGNTLLLHCCFTSTEARWLIRQHPNKPELIYTKRQSHQSVEAGHSTIQYNFIAKCQYTDCTWNVLWCQVHSSHIHSNHKTFNYNNSK